MEVTINNKTSLDLLNNTLDTLHSLMEKYEVDPYDPNQHLISPGLEDWDDVEKTIQCTTEEFLKTNHWNNYNDHIGYPVEFRAYPIEHMSAKSQEFYDFWAYLKYEMPAELGATANALCAYYPIMVSQDGTLTGMLMRINFYSHGLKMVMVFLDTTIRKMKKS